MKAGKWKKPNKLDNSEVQRFQCILESLRDEALSSLNHLDDETRSVDSSHVQDMREPCIILSRESLFQETERRRIMVRMIDAALDRIKHGSFGICVACGDGVKTQRLEALPWSQYCLPCQQAFEREAQVKHLPDPAERRTPLGKAG